MFIFEISNCAECFDFDILDIQKFANVPYSNIYCKWLDYIIGRKANIACISIEKVLYDMIGSNHAAGRCAE